MKSNRQAVIHIIDLLSRWQNPQAREFLTAFALREKCKAGAFIFPYRSPRSGPEPEGLKGGKSAKSTGNAAQKF